MINRKPMTTDRLFSLKPGDSFVVYLARDDDPENLVFDYKTQMVREFLVTEHDVLGPDVTLVTMDNCRWLKKHITEPTTNVLDTGRGYAFFFEV